MKFRGFLILILLASLLGCSSAKKKVEPTRIRNFFAVPIRVRWFYEKPDQNQTYGCKKAVDLFQGRNLRATYSCFQRLNELAKPIQFRYVLDVDEKKPVLRLKSKESSCLNETLAEIPVPREIYFRRKDKKSRLQCWGAELDVGKGSVLGVPLPSRGKHMNLTFPQTTPAETFEQFKRQIIALTISPFFASDDEGGYFPAYFVPERICEVCWGMEPLDKKVPDYYPSWP